MDAQELNRMISNEGESLILGWYPEARRAGGGWEMGSVDGGKGASCSVFRGRGGGYMFKEGNPAGPFACGVHTGSMIHLWAHNNSCTFRDACQQIERHLGVHHVITVKPKANPPEPPPKQNFLPTRESEVQKYLRDERGLLEPTLIKYRIRRYKRVSKWNDHHYGFPYTLPDGRIVMHKTIGVLRKEDGKKDVWSSKPFYTLFGWWLADDNTSAIAICEGELDAASAHQMGAPVPCLSLPSGGSNMTWLENDYDHLRTFDTIYLVGDNDEAGEAWCAEAAKRLGLSRCFRVKVPSEFNDLNEWLVNGKGDQRDAIQDVFKEAGTYNPPTLSNAHDGLTGALRRRAEIESNTKTNDWVFPDLPFKLCDHDTTILQGYPAHGKSDFGNFMFLHEMKMGHRCCIAAYDTPKDDLIVLSAWQMAGHQPSEHDIKRCVEMLEDRLFFIDGVENEIGAANLLADMEYAVKRFGVDRFLIDNLHEVHGIKKDDYDAQDTFVRKLDKFDKHHGTHTVLVAHSLFNSDSETRIPDKGGVEGSKGMVKPIQNGLTIWRNKVKEKPDDYEDGDRTPKRIRKYLDGADTYLSVWKQRNGFRTEFIRGLMYDVNSRRYTLEHRKFFSPYPDVPPKQVEVLEDATTQNQEEIEI